MTWQMITYVSVAVAAAAALGFGGWKGWQFWRKFSSRPKSYFLRYLDDAQKQSLSLASIEYQTGSAPDGNPGVIIKYDDLERALPVLRAISTASVPLAGKQLHEAVLAFPHPQAARKDPQEIAVYHSKRRDKVTTPRVQKVVHSVLAGRYNGSLSVSLDGGSRHYTFDDDLFPDFVEQVRRLNIVFGSTPKATDREMLPPRAFDIELTPQQASRYSKKGAPITDPATGYIAGEVTQDTLYIYADFWQMGEEQRLALLTRILQRMLLERDPAAFLPEVISEESHGVPPPGERQSIADENFSGAEERAIVRSMIHNFLAPYVNQEIHVRNCEGHTHAPLNDGMFHVFFNSAAAGSRTESMPKKLLGCDVIREDKAFGPTGLGTPLFEKDGFIYAELVGDNLYLHQYLLTHASKAEAKLLARLFVKAGLLVQKQREREGGPRFTEDDLKEELALIAAGVNAAGKKDASPFSEDELSKTLREAAGADAEVFRLEKSGSEELGREYDDLCRVYKVRSVEVKKSSIVIMTDMLYCVDPRSEKRHEIGEFKITIPMDHHSEVTWLNQTRTIKMDGRTMHAPHVSSRGQACFGNTQDLFPMLIKKREFATAVQLAIAFVESVNVSDSWGKGISLFPVAAGNVQ